MSTCAGRIIRADLWRGEWDFEVAFEKVPDLRFVFRNSKQRAVGRRVEVQFSGNHPDTATEVHVRFLDSVGGRDELTLSLGTVTYFYKKTPSRV
ncbi:hypothetical protein COU17_01715 [Candidatus Kaiserbacteria bacterium CG10_big_fil_rev_8_21_14_0_10_49_17]|uniref:Uncharacterized protein n=1 Tax=Candidatus Kaiserbacteria bacterium CG10_big_fil_rev_8_21_14_0_10_49_17 TaxID=1974609 RepID=A0A2M6WEI6_9BACT|nr:MAG: hypothetical protein COU17_01715 [Candidatus Kaiserbacteria bacterium CG10_big_fil_rev_8_21_14_0_10_49_17]